MTVKFINFLDIFKTLPNLPLSIGGHLGTFPNFAVTSLVTKIYGSFCKFLWYCYLTKTFFNFTKFKLKIIQLLSIFLPDLANLHY
jgi:hypothetical protein